MTHQHQCNCPYCPSRELEITDRLQHEIENIRAWADQKGIRIVRNAGIWSQDVCAYLGVSLKTIQNSGDDRMPRQYLNGRVFFLLHDIAKAALQK
jgi:hypothetical protein